MYSVRVYLICISRHRARLRTSKVFQLIHTDMRPFSLSPVSFPDALVDLLVRKPLARFEILLLERRI